MVFGFGGGKPSEGRAGVSEALRLARKRAVALIADNALALARAPRRQSAPPSHRAYPSPQLAGGHEPVPRLTPQEQGSLARAPRRDGGLDVADTVGKIWNGHNTFLGLGYGGVGHVVGEAGHVLNRDAPRPKVVVGDNAVQFRDNPFGGVSAITIGNTSTYSPGYATPDVVQHEKQHTYQGQHLGPLYLPSNLLGGTLALLRDRDENGRPNWHGPSNWNERGPLVTPPRPWPNSAPR